MRLGALAAPALCVAPRIATAQEVPVWLVSGPHAALGSRIALELQALGHPVLRAESAPGAVASIRLVGARGLVLATIEAPGSRPVEVEIHVDDTARLDAEVVRAVESLRALLLQRPRAQRAPGMPQPPATRWFEHLRGAVGAAVTAGPSAGASAGLWLRAAWESVPWVEVVGVVPLSDIDLGGGAALRATTVTLGLGAPLLRGSVGALGLTLRGGVAWVQARGERPSEGAIAVVEGALVGRIQVWRRLAVLASGSVGTSLASVRVRSGGTELTDWGRPYLTAALGLSY